MARVIGIRSGDVSMKVEWRDVEVTKAVRDAVSAELFESAERIAKGAASRAPRDTGGHAGEFKAKKANKRGTNLTGRPAASHVIGSELTGILEWGTVHQDAQPHVYPAFDEELPRLQARLTDLLDRAAGVSV